MVTAVQRNQIVREACRQARWYPHRTFNDRCKTHRRVAFCNLGHTVSPKMREKVEELVHSKLLAAGAKFNNVYWYRADGMLGWCDKLVVEVPL